MSDDGWPQARLGSVLSLAVEKVTVEPGTEYPMVGVYSFGRGLFDREPVNGGATSYRHFYRLNPHHIVMSQLFGWEGALALSSDEFAGKYVSPQFPTFVVDESQVTRGFVGWYIRRAALWGQLATQTRGMGDRRRTLNPETLLSCTIPLPPLAEQRRIVAKIDSLAAKIDEAQELNNLAGLQSSLLAVAMAHRTDLSREAKEAAGWKEATLGDIIKTEFDDEPVIETENYPNFGIYSYGRGLFPKPPISGLATSATRLRRVHAGQFIYSRLFAWEGSFGLVTDEYDGWFVSGEYPTFCCDRSRILPEFLFAYFKAERAWASVALGSKGLGSRRQRVQPDQILAHKLLLPPMEVQLQIKSVIARDSEIVEARSALKNELDALLPSILDRAFSGAL